MFSDRSKIILVMPCYNEAVRLPVKAIEDFVAEQHGAVEILLVNDGSTDATGKIIDSLANGNPNIQTLHLQQNVGKAEAVRHGILIAIEKQPGWVGFWDADMATPLDELNHFMANANRGEFEMIVGCRLKRLGAGVNRKLSRHYLGRIFATTVSALLHLSLYDSQCGAKIIRRELAEKVFVAPFISRWLFDVEIFRRIVKLYGPETTERVIYECPLYRWVDVPGSKLTIGKMLQTPFELWKIFHS